MAGAPLTMLALVFSLVRPVIDGLSRAGNLYNWYATIDERGLCPAGFIVPSYNDWETLIVNLRWTRKCQCRAEG